MPKRRLSVRVIVYACLAAAILSIFVPLFFPAGPNPRALLARDKSVQMLADAADENALEEAVNEFRGVVFHLVDDSWIAIRYVDSHGPLWSSSVALDSDGRWYESDVHFCGTLNGYRYERDKLAKSLDDPDHSKNEKRKWVQFFLQNKNYRLLNEIENCGDLECARPKLAQLGFRERAEPTKPKMTGHWPTKVEHQAQLISRLIR